MRERDDQIINLFQDVFKGFQGTTQRHLDSNSSCLFLYVFMSYMYLTSVEIIDVNTKDGYPVSH